MLYELAAIVIISWIIIVNNLARKEVKVNEALSGIEVALEKRYDVLTKMLDVVKGYEQHEKEIFKETIRLRNGMNVMELSEENAKLNDMQSYINVLVESYAALHSDTVFVELQKAIRDVEENLQAARRIYNSNVSLYNQQMKVFPASIVAHIKRLSPKSFFEAEQEKRNFEGEL